MCLVGWFFCVLALRMYSQTYLIFCSGFVICLIAFFEQITYFCTFCFFQVFSVSLPGCYGLSGRANWLFLRTELAVYIILVKCIWFVVLLFFLISILRVSYTCYTCCFLHVFSMPLPHFSCLLGLKIHFFLRTELAACISLVKDIWFVVLLLFLLFLFCVLSSFLIFWFFPHLYTLQNASCTHIWGCF